MRYVDLHLHTLCSDGADPPASVVCRASELGLAAVAITDHDTVAGIPEARATAEALGVEFLPGVEISTWFDGAEVHIVGLGIREDEPVLAAGLQRQHETRRARVRRILELLRVQGAALDDEAVLRRGREGSLGRMHVAVALRDAGITRTVQEGFDRFLNTGRPAYVPKQMATAEDAVSWIHQAGGLAFVAHPGLGQATRRRLPALLALPFDGIEAYHTSHSPGETDGYIQLAQERELLIAGGSDCHGRIKGEPPEMGKVRVPYRHFAMLKAALGLH